MPQLLHLPPPPARRGPHTAPRRSAGCLPQDELDRALARRHNAGPLPDLGLGKIGPYLRLLVLSAPEHDASLREGAPAVWSSAVACRLIQPPRVQVTFHRMPDGGSVEVMPPPPSILPILDDDLFYPFSTGPPRPAPPVANGRARDASGSRRTRHAACPCAQGTRLPLLRCGAGSGGQG